MVFHLLLMRKSSKYASSCPRVSGAAHPASDSVDRALIEIGKCEVLANSKSCEAIRDTARAAARGAIR